MFLLPVALMAQSEYVRPKPYSGYQYTEDELNTDEFKTYYSLFTSYEGKPGLSELIRRNKESTAELLEVFVDAILRYSDNPDGDYFVEQVKLIGLVSILYRNFHGDSKYSSALNNFIEKYDLETDAKSWKFVSGAALLFSGVKKDIESNLSEAYDFLKNEELSNQNIERILNKLESVRIVVDYVYWQFDRDIDFKETQQVSDVTSILSILYAFLNKDEKFDTLITQSIRSGNLEMLYLQDEKFNIKENRNSIEAVIKKCIAQENEFKLSTLLQQSIGIELFDSLNVNQNRLYNAFLLPITDSHSSEELAFLKKKCTDILLLTDEVPSNSFIKLGGIKSYYNKILSEIENHPNYIRESNRSYISVLLVVGIALLVIIIIFFLKRRTAANTA